VAGVEVGHATIISDLPRHAAPPTRVRTGVTVLFPRGRKDARPVYAGFFSLNGNGEFTGTHWIEESGFLNGPVGLTNTLSVGTVHSALVEWWLERRGSGPDADWTLPAVAETWDGYLNDIAGRHVRGEHVRSAIDAAAGGPVTEGSVGGGTGMVAYEFKAGIGTSSRRLGERDGGYTVGVLVQANHGRREQLRIAGVPVGREITEGAFKSREAGSVVVLVATDAPLLPGQLKRLARRGALGIARGGSTSGNGSGDLMLAFSTGNPAAGVGSEVVQLVDLPNHRLDPLFGACVEATEEAVVNALVAARTMEGVDGHRVVGLPHDLLRSALEHYRRLVVDPT
jgi:D-aminopeptidase